MEKLLRVLMVEDSEDDVFLEIRVLKKSGYDPEYIRVDTAETMAGALREKTWDVVLCDYKLPVFSGLEAIALLKRINLDIPLIIVSGTIGEETAAECMRMGAHDYIMKDNLSRLVPAIEREMKEAKSRAERRRAEAAFQESEMRYRMLFNNSMDALFVTVPDGSILSANPAACRMFGRSEEEIIALGRKALIDEHDPRLAEGLKLREKTGYFKGELTGIRADGTQFPVEASSAVYQDSNGQIRTAVIMHDITQRKQAEQLIRDSERRLQELLDNMSSCVAVYKAVDDGNDFIIMDFNRAAEKAEKIDRRQIIGKSIHKVFPGAAEMGIVEVLQKVWRSGQAEHVPASFYRDGRISGWRENYIYKLPTGEIVALYNDITERKKVEIKIFESEEKYRLLVENSSEAIFINQNGMLQFVNRASLTLFDSPYEVLVTTPFTQFIYPDDREKVNSLHLSQLKGEKVSPSCTFRIITKGDIVKWVEMHSTVVSWQGKPATLDFLDDVTKRTKAEDAIRDISAIQNLILENSTLGIALVRNRSFVWVNERLAEILRIPVEKLQGAPARIMYPSDEVYREVAETAYKLLEEGSRSDNVFQLVRSDGSLFWCRFLGKALNSAKPDEGSIWMFEDITERKQAEEELQELHKQMQDAYKFARIGSWRWNLGNNEVTFSEELAGMVGLGFKSLVFKSDKHPRIYTRTSWEQLKQVVKTCLKTGKSQRMELRAVPIQGVSRWLDWIANAIYDKQGNMIGLHGTVQDITERKQAEGALKESEDLFRKLFEDHAAVKLLIDGDTGKIIDANNAAATFYGWSKDQLTQMSISDLNILPAAEVRRAIEKVKNEKRIHFEFRHRLADGSIRDVEVFSSCIEVKGKKLLHSVIHDISERKTAENLLKESEEKYRNIFEHAVEGIFQSTPDGRYINVNPAFAQIGGFGSPEEMINATTDIQRQMYVNPEDRTRLIEILKKQSFVNNYEAEIRRKDGVTVWISMNVRPVKNVSGDIVMLEGTITDITERKKTDAEVKLNEARMESLLRINMHSAENIQDLLDFALGEAVVLTGSEIGYIYLYDESKKEFMLNSWSKEVMDQCTVAEPQTVYKLDKTGIWGEAVRQRKSIMLNNFAAPNPLKKGLPEGHAPLRKYLTLPVFWEGHIVAVIGVANKKDDYNDSDIRQLGLMMDAVWKIVKRGEMENLLKISEKKYRNIFEYAVEGIFQSTLEGKYISLNPAFVRIRGYDSAEELINTTEDVQKQAYVHPEDRQKMINMLKEHGFVSDFEVESRRKDGTRIWLSMNARPVRDENGKMVMIEGTITDITERKSIEIELQRKNAELARAYEELKARQNLIIGQEKMASIGMLAAGVAHEIKNPLAIMLQGINYLQSPAREESLQKEVLSRLHEAVRRADVIVKGLLSYARQTPLSLNVHDIHELIDDCLALTEHELRKKNIRVIKNYASDLPKVQVDANQIKQVCINLIINGIDAMSKDGVFTITTGKIKDSENKAFLEITVSDTGHGISADKIDKIFDPFYTTKSIGSTGLGLSISRGIIDQHGGMITAASKEGQGASITFKLPVTA